MPTVPTLCKFFATVRYQEGANGLLAALYLVTIDQFEKVGLKFGGCVHKMYETRPTYYLFGLKCEYLLLDQIRYHNKTKLSMFGFRSGL